MVHDSLGSVSNSSELCTLLLLKASAFHALLLADWKSSINCLLDLGRHTYVVVVKRMETDFYRAYS